ncbi:hypothetical protein OCK74_19960 [Chitinophagaceae bacterium LB-8]|uniref:Fibronectin type-III domain-containing protein n=1 Tax=Paraflavisolibacter caeni TaxID=2982496 RepID=A0A9X3BJM4_9BACT|nr:hypothetical protein [Paraflavisolibacter caeni]MCU7551408.1 hypothetical protein [Paraflavisolibacter caeni]
MKLFRFFVCLLFIITACTKDAETPNGKGNINEIETADVTGITATSVIAGGKVNVISTVPVTQRGICWATTEKPTTANPKFSQGAGNDPFTRAISGLLPGTTYYLRAYLISNSLTMYGEQMQFRTKDTTPIVTNTTSPNTITTISASSGGNITSDGGKAITARGVCWSNTTNPTISNSKTSDGTGTGSFTSSLTGLTPNTTYYVRAYATSELGTSYGPQTSFNTGVSVPTLNTTVASAITASTATTGGTIVTDGGNPITAKGVCWFTTPNPTISNLKTSDGTGASSFTSNMTGLIANTTYYVRAYATNGYGTSYGDQIQFKTGASIGTLITTSASAITASTATSGGNITSDGGSPVTARGICWSTSSAPTISNSNTNDGAGTGSFTSNMTGLAPGTVYYVRAYVTNAYGTAYGQQIQFTTSYAPASLTTVSASSITATTASTGGNVTSDGGYFVNQRGVCWSTNPNPTVANSSISNGTGTGSYSCVLTGLTPNTTYYVRAYAMNTFATAYGQQIQFTTSASVPVVTGTSAAYSITGTSAYSGGSMSSDGGSPVTAKGVCWSTSINPTISNTKTNEGAGVGGFASYMSGLSPNTTYYVRAYATNAYGTVYGAQIQFTTTASVPVISATTTVTSITRISASSGGTISSDGGSAVTAKGVCWSTAPNPTTSNTKTSNGTGTGSYASSLTGLSPNTTYYVRAYATNAYGTVYGSQLQFTTLP